MIAVRAGRVCPVASEPVDAARECWQALPCNTLVAVQGGAVTFSPFEIALKQAA